MRKTRLILVPGAKDLTQMCCLLLYLSCPMIGAFCRQQLDTARDDLYSESIYKIHGNKEPFYENEEICYIADSHINCKIKTSDNLKDGGLTTSNEYSESFMQGILYETNTLNDGFQCTTGIEINSDNNRSASNLYDRKNEINDSFDVLSKHSNYRKPQAKKDLHDMSSSRYNQENHKTSNRREIRVRNTFNMFDYRRKTGMQSSRQLNSEDRSSRVRSDNNSIRREMPRSLIRHVSDTSDTRNNGEGRRLGRERVNNRRRSEEQVIRIAREVRQPLTNIEDREMSRRLARRINNRFDSNNNEITRNTQRKVISSRQRIDIHRNVPVERRIRDTRLPLTSVENREMSERRIERVNIRGGSNSMEDTKNKQRDLITNRQRTEDRRNTRIRSTRDVRQQMPNNKNQEEKLIRRVDTGYGSKNYENKELINNKQKTDVYRNVQVALNKRDARQPSRDAENRETSERNIRLINDKSNNNNNNVMRYFQRDPNNRQNTEGRRDVLSVRNMRAVRQPLTNIENRERSERLTRFDNERFDRRYNSNTGLVQRELIVDRRMSGERRIKQTTHNVRQLSSANDENQETSGRLVRQFSNDRIRRSSGDIRKIQRNAYNSISEERRNAQVMRNARDVKQQTMRIDVPDLSRTLNRLANNRLDSKQNDDARRLQREVIKSRTRSEERLNVMSIRDIREVRQEFINTENQEMSRSLNRRVNDMIDSKDNTDARRYQREVSNNRQISEDGRNMNSIRSIRDARQMSTNIDNRETSRSLSRRTNNRFDSRDNEGASRFQRDVNNNRQRSEERRNMQVVRTRRDVMQQTRNIENLETTRVQRMRTNDRFDRRNNDFRHFRKENSNDRKMSEERLNTRVIRNTRSVMEQRNIENRELSRSQDRRVKDRFDSRDNDNARRYQRVVVSNSRQISEERRNMQRIRSMRDVRQPLTNLENREMSRILNGRTNDDNIQRTDERHRTQGMRKTDNVMKQTTNIENRRMFRSLSRRNNDGLERRSIDGARHYRRDVNNRERSKERNNMQVIRKTRDVIEQTTNIQNREWTRTLNRRSNIRFDRNIDVTRFQRDVVGSRQRSNDRRNMQVSRNARDVRQQTINVDEREMLGNQVKHDNDNSRRNKEETRRVQRSANVFNGALRGHDARKSHREHEDTRRSSHLLAPQHHMMNRQSILRKHEKFMTNPSGINTQQIYPNSIVYESETRLNADMGAVVRVRFSAGKRENYIHRHTRAPQHKTARTYFDMHKNYNGRIGGFDKDSNVKRVRSDRQIDYTVHNRQNEMNSKPIATRTNRVQMSPKKLEALKYVGKNEENFPTQAFNLKLSSPNSNEVMHSGFNVSSKINSISLESSVSYDTRGQDGFFEFQTKPFETTKNDRSKWATISTMISDIFSSKWITKEDIKVAVVGSIAFMMTTKMKVA